MLIGLKSLVLRTAPTLGEDALGALALLVMLLVGLSFPGFI